MVQFTSNSYNCQLTKNQNIKHNIRTLRVDYSRLSKNHVIDDYLDSSLNAIVTLGLKSIPASALPS